MNKSDFIENGFDIFSPFLNLEECTFYATIVSDITSNSVGTRNLLDLFWCQELAKRIQDDHCIASILPKNSVAAQCTYFEKSVDQNWLVSIHQDLSIPVAEKIEHPELNGWAEKEGVVFVQPPENVLNEVVVVRLHIDDCGISDGPLRVVAGSHKFGRLPNVKAMSLRDQIGETICMVPKGGALLMKPLVLHASSKSLGISKRRVLHFVFGPPKLPFGLKWKIESNTI